jgi:hypothetical protein
MNALPEDLNDDWFYFFTFGPRTGESILLRIPPDAWVVVDSFKCDDQAAADNGNNTRLWVVTPFETSALPSAADDHGLDRLLQYVSTVYLTGLPFNHSHEHEAPCVATRKQIRDGRRPQRRLRNPAPITTADLDRHIIVAFDRTGQIQEVRHGPGSVKVNR